MDEVGSASPLPGGIPRSKTENEDEDENDWGEKSDPMRDRSAIR
jgi:hypothetical protein